jgi:hypothetical protein
MSAKIDFSDFSALVPDKTVATVHLRVRHHVNGVDSILKPTKDGDAHGLDVEYTVLDGQYAGSKFLQFHLVQGTKEGQQSMARTNCAYFKGVIDSAKFLDPRDMSEATRAARTAHWRDLDGLKFLAEISIEPGKEGFPDKNVIRRAITKDMPAWGGRPPIEQGPPNGAGAPVQPSAPSPSRSSSEPPAPPISKPSWAQ